MKKYLLLFMLFSCKNDISFDENFSFTVRTNTFIISSKENKYTVLKSHKDTSTYFLFSKKEIKEIQKIFLKEKINNMPKKYQTGSCKESAFPFRSTSITINYQKKQYIFLIEDCEKYSTEDAFNVLKIENFLKKIIETTFSKAEIKRMPKSNLGYVDTDFL